MSMHLEKAFISTTNYGGKGKRKPNTAAQRKADAEHDAWLRKRGLHPDQRRDKQIKGVASIPNYREGITSKIPLSNAVGNGYKSGVMENLHKEAPHVQKAILDKASRVMPLYNKGGLQYCTPETDLKTVGTKSRRG